MGLKGDVDELLNAWKNFSGLGKLVFGVSLVMGFLSVASLADGIVQFRSFIANAVDLYQWITFPIRHLISIILRIELTQVKLDYLVVASILYFRVYAVARDIASESPEATWIWHFMTGLGGLFIGTLFTSKTYIDVLVFMFLPPIVCYLTPLIFRSPPTHTGRKRLFKVANSIVLIYASFATIAAVIEGTTRTLD